MRGIFMAENKQTVILEDRRRLSVSGISNVDSFDEQKIELSGTMGGLDISGAELKIAALDLEKGHIAINGVIESIIYCQSREERSMRHKSKSALSRLLK